MVNDIEVILRNTGTLELLGFDSEQRPSSQIKACLVFIWYGFRKHASG
jgi:hypothetical protein